jgi:putative protease
MPEKILVGKITHYFTNINVAVIELEGEIKLGDKLLFEGATTNFEQPLDSMEIDRKPIETAGKGQSIGLKVKDRVRLGDKVYKIVE